MKINNTNTRVELNPHHLGMLYKVGDLMAQQIAILCDSNPEEREIKNKLDKMHRLVFGILRSQPRLSPGDFDITDYIPNNSIINNNLRCLYYEDGNVVATDGRILLQIPCRYKRKFEKQCIRPDGTILKGHRYVDYKHAIPSPDNIGTRQDIPLYAIKRVLNDFLYERFRKSNKISIKFEPTEIVQVFPHAFIQAKYLYLIYKAIPKIRTTEFCLDKEKKTIMLKSKKGLIVVLLEPMWHTSLENYNIKKL